MARIEIRLKWSAKIPEAVSPWIQEDILKLNGKLMHELSDERDDFAFDLGQPGFLLVTTISKIQIISLRIDGKVVWVNTDKTG